MKQMSLASSGFELQTKRTRKREFLDEMGLVVPWGVLVALIAPHAPQPSAKDGRPPFGTETMLRIHFMQQWFGLSDPAMEEALYDVPMYREFAGLHNGIERLPDENTILRFRHLLEQHDLSMLIMGAINATLATKGLLLETGSVVDATLIAAPSSTKNSTGERDPEMQQTKKGNQWRFGMKAHIGVDAESGLVHIVIGTVANVNDVTQGHVLLHGEEEVVFGKAGYQGADIREEATSVAWHIAMRTGKRSQSRHSPWGALTGQIEHLKAGIRAKVEHPFRVIKRQFGHTKVRYRGLKKNTQQLYTLFSLSNLWMAWRTLLREMHA
jgi:IS5 family transposase